MRVVSLLVFAVSLTACTYVRDGEYVQTEGPRIDYQKVDALTKGVSTLSDAVERLGEPSRRYAGPGDREVLEYVSVKTRESHERTFGIDHGSVVQSLHVKLALTFEHGILLSKDTIETITRKD